MLFFLCEVPTFHKISDLNFSYSDVTGILGPINVLHCLGLNCHAHGKMKLTLKSTKPKG